MQARNVPIDTLKVFLAISVVLLHGNLLIEENQFVSFLLVNGVFRIAVPIFFIINGYYFIAVLDNNSIASWFKRVLILYLIWTLIYFPFWINLDVKNLLLSLFIGHHHLWYIKALLLAGIMLYSFRNLKTKFLISLSLVLFIFGVGLQYLANYHLVKTTYIDDFLNHYYVYRNFLFVGFPFFTIGYLLKRTDWKLKLSFHKRLFVLLISGSLLLLESAYNYYHSHEVFDLFISLIVIAPLTFLSFKDFKFKTNSNTKKLSLLATAIYLVHPWVYVINFKILHWNKLELIPITILLSYLISLILIKIQTKFKYIL